MYERTVHRILGQKTSIYNTKKALTIKRRYFCGHNG